MEDLSQGTHYELRVLEDLVRRGHADTESLDLARERLNDPNPNIRNEDLIEEWALSIPDDLTNSLVEAALKHGSIDVFLISPWIIRRNRELCIPLALDGLAGDTDAQESYRARRIIQYSFLEPWAKKEWLRVVNSSQLVRAISKESNEPNLQDISERVRELSEQDLRIMFLCDWFTTAAMMDKVLQAAAALSPSERKETIYHFRGDNEIYRACLSVLPRSLEATLQGFVVADLMIGADLPESPEIGSLLYQAASKWGTWGLSGSREYRNIVALNDYLRQRSVADRVDPILRYARAKDAVARYQTEHETVKAPGKTHSDESRPVSVLSPIEYERKVFVSGWRATLEARYPDRTDHRQLAKRLYAVKRRSGISYNTIVQAFDKYDSPEQAIDALYYEHLKAKDSSKFFFDGAIEDKNQVTTREATTSGTELPELTLKFSSNSPLQFLEHLESDSRTRIEAKIGRLLIGLTGDTKQVRRGLYQAAVDSGPGYRIYFSLTDSVFTIRKIGTKSTQDRDIDQAEVELKGR